MDLLPEGQSVLNFEVELSFQAFGIHQHQIQAMALFQGDLFVLGYGIEIFSIMEIIGV